MYCHTEGVRPACILNTINISMNVPICAIACHFSNIMCCLFLKLKPAPIYTVKNLRCPNCPYLQSGGYFPPGAQSELSSPQPGESASMASWTLGWGSFIDLRVFKRTKEQKVILETEHYTTHTHPHTPTVQTRPLSGQKVFLLILCCLSVLCTGNVCVWRCNSN